jgi:hypothetical protein
LIVWLTGTALFIAAPAHAQNAGVLRVSGSVDGDVAEGERIVVHADLRHNGGYRKIDEIRVSLTSNGVEVEAVSVEPNLNSITMLGVGSKSLVDASPLEGAFFRVSGQSIRLDARGKQLKVTIPITLLSDPPEGSRLEISANAGLASAGPEPVSQPVEHRSAISWAGILLAGAVALFAGAVLGASVGARRRPRSSVYDSVRRRIDDTAGEPAAGETRPVAARASTDDGTAAPPVPPTRKKASARKAPAKKAPAKKAPAKTSAAKKTSAKKPSARRPAAKRAAPPRRRPSGGGRGGSTT